MKKEKGAIGIFVLIGMLFMASFLMILFANNMNKEKGIQEQFEILEKIYALSGGDESVYQKVYEDLREKNKQILTASVENKGNMELTKTFAEEVTNYKIYGKTIEYQEVEYIESTGTQYIDTKTYLTVDTEIQSEFLFTGSNGSYPTPYGSKNPSLGLYYNLRSYYSLYWFW